MKIEPLVSASVPIAEHTLAALVTLLVGAIQLVLAKKGFAGTFTHKVLGYTWVILLLFVAASSFFIHELKTFGLFSPIHLVSIFTIFLLLRAVSFARRGNIRAHKRAMILLYFLALVATGLFTLLPGRIMHEVVFSS